MPDTPTEISARTLRQNLAATLNDVAVRGHTVYVTNHGRRIAAIVPVPAAEQMARLTYDK
jgi:prevent-host-death family protein